MEKAMAYEDQEYVQRLVAAQEKIVEIIGPRYAAVDIAHDDWCRLRRQSGWCNCDPHIFVYATCGTFQIMRDGSIEWRLDLKNPYLIPAGPVQ